MYNFYAQSQPKYPVPRTTIPQSQTLFFTCLLFVSLSHFCKMYLTRYLTLQTDDDIRCSGSSISGVCNHLASPSNGTRPGTRDSLLMQLNDACKECLSNDNSVSLPVQIFVVSARDILARLLHVPVDQNLEDAANTEEAKEALCSLRGAYERIEGDSNIPATFKKYAENILCLCGKKSKSLCRIQQKQSLLEFYSIQIGITICKYLNLRECLSLSLLSKSFHKVFLQIHLGLGSESWIRAYCTFGLENSSRSVLQLHNPNRGMIALPHWVRDDRFQRNVWSDANSKMLLLRRSIIGMPRELRGIHDRIIALRNTVGCLHMLAKKRRDRGVRAITKQMPAHINAAYFLEVLKTVRHLYHHMLPKSLIAVSLMAKEFNSTCNKICEDRVFLRWYVNQYVDLRLVLDDDDIRERVMTCRNQCSVAARIFYVNTSLCFFSFHLFMFWRRRIVYSRTFNNTETREIFLQRQFVPFDRREHDLPYYGDYSEETKETTVHGHHMPRHLNFVRNFTLSMLNYDWDSQRCPCGHNAFLRHMGFSNTFPPRRGRGRNEHNTRCRPDFFQLPHFMDHLQLETGLTLDCHPTRDGGDEVLWLSGPEATLSFYHEKKIAHVLMIIARQRFHLSDKFLTNPRIQRVDYDSLHRRMLDSGDQKLTRYANNFRTWEHLGAPGSTDIVN